MKSDYKIDITRIPNIAGHVLYIYKNDFVQMNNNSVGTIKVNDINFD